MHVGGSSNNQGAGDGIVLISSTSVLHESSLTISFPASNAAEYEALISGLNIVEAMSVKKLIVYSDSQLVVNQLSSEYEARDERMCLYLSSAISLIKKLKGIRIEHIIREQNSHVDALIGLALTCHVLGPRGISFRTIDNLSFELELPTQEMMNIDLGLS